MNCATISGRIAGAPNAVGDGKTTIKFTVKTTYPGRDVSKPTIAYVPVVLFDASEVQQEILLANKELDKFRIELVGRVVRSGYDGSEGKRVYSTQVVANPKGVLFIREK